MSAAHDPSTRKGRARVNVTDPPQHFCRCAASLPYEHLRHQEHGIQRDRGDQQRVDELEPAAERDVYHRERRQDQSGRRDVRDEALAVVVRGDDRGALALGRLAPAIIKENDYDMLMVINCFRPLTRKAAEVIEVMREIEHAGGIKFTGLVNNSNLGEETTPEDVLSS